MSAAKRIHAIQLARIIRTLVAHSVRLATVASAHAAGLDSVDVARVEQQLHEAQYARIGIEGRTHVLTRPRAAPQGLGYAQVEKASRHRYEFLAGADRVVSPPNPVPWSRLDQIEAGDRSRGRSTITGGAVGFLIGAAMGAGLARYGSGASGEDWNSDSWKVTLIGGAMFAVVGAGIGALAPSTKWKQVYLQPQR